MSATAASVPEPSWNVRAGVEVACLVGMGVAGLSAWCLGIVFKGYDYDEVLRAHSIWLASRGLRPYTDFFEVHPPYFPLLAPLMRVVTEPVAQMRALRLLAGLGNVWFLVGLGVLALRSLPEGAGRRWVGLVLAFVAGQPVILDGLVEFRVDGWGYALIVWATVRWWGRERSLRRTVEFGALTALAVALFAPKAAFLPPLIALFGIILGDRPGRAAVRTGVAYLAGVGLAVVVVLIYLDAARIGLGRTLLLLGRYHAASNAHAGFGHGLLQRVLTLRLLLALTLAGCAAWAVGWVRQGRPGGPFEPAVAVWLVLHLVLVSYPYKQYYVPWFLFGSVFVPSLGPVCESILRRAHVLVYVAACVASVWGSVQIGRLWVQTAGADTDNALIRWMNAVSGRDDRVVGSPPYHPIDRRDTFFLSFNTTDPGGFDSERICRELPGLRELVTAEHYREEFAANPPAVVVLASPFFEVRYPRIQRRVLEEELRRRGYFDLRVRGVWFALRPDRYERARLGGYVP